MKYVITGGAGNISRPLTLALLKAGHQVTVIGRNAGNLKELVSEGAVAAIGSVEDVDFLARTFKGADAVYSMIPPAFHPADWKAYIGQIGANYAQAIRQAGVKNVVNLSSVGAHKPDGVGPVSGLFRAEKALNELETVNILHLRPSYFYQNLLANIPLVKQAGITGSNFDVPSGKFPIVHTSDIAEVAADALLQLNFSGHTYRYIASDETGTAEIAAAFGNAIGKPGLPWVKFEDDQALQGMIQAGLPEEIAKNYVEMGTAIQSGTMLEDYWQNRPALGKVKLADFAQQFAAIFRSA